MKKAVQTVRARHGERYVWKTEHADLSSPSKDGMGYVPDGPIVNGQRTRMVIWDMIDGTTRKPRPAGESEPIREAYALTPDPKDWLAGDPPPPPPPPDEIGKLRNELHAAVADLLGKYDAQQRTLDGNTSTLALLVGDVEALKHAPPPVAVIPKLRVRGSTGRSFGHGHSVDLPVVAE
jgi:hypothetical protein